MKKQKISWKNFSGKIAGLIFFLAALAGFSGYSLRDLFMANSTENVHNMQEANDLDSMPGKAIITNGQTFIDNTGPISITNDFREPKDTLN